VVHWVLNFIDNFEELTARFSTVILIYMTQPLTQEDLRVGLKEFGKQLKTEIKESFRDELRVTTREIIGHFNQSQTIQNQRMDRMEKRLDSVDEKLETIGEDVAKVKLAVLDLMATGSSPAQSRA